jgi:hypothetical protein
MLIANFTRIVQFKQFYFASDRNLRLTCYNINWGINNRPSGGGGGGKNIFVVTVQETVMLAYTFYVLGWVFFYHSNPLSFTGQKKHYLPILLFLHHWTYQQGIRMFYIHAMAKKAVARWALPSRGYPIIAKGEKEICVPMRTNKSDLGHFHSFSNAKEI